MKRTLVTLAFCCQYALLPAQPVSVTASLPRSSPEAENVSSADLLRFLEAMENSAHEFHSVMVLRHGKVILEGWWKPYAPNLVHTMYSVSKSFTATAIGFAVSEGKISVEDKVTSFFPEELPNTLSENLKALRIRDLLSMSVGQATEPTNMVGSYNWVRNFFTWPIAYEPGSRFLYNSAATYMLSAIIQKISGQQLLTYLQSRLFDPLGIKGIDWETDPSGINTGGWGLRLKTEDMAKFGQLFLQRGQWQGKQVLPAAWVDSASSRKIWQDPNAPASKKDSSDWLQGYCYQMWRGRHNTFRGDGAFGQYIIVVPEADAVVIITSETTDMQGEQNIIWNYLLPAFRNSPVKADKRARKQLQAKLTTLEINPRKRGWTAENQAPSTEAQRSLEKTLQGRSFGVVSMRRGLDSLSFRFTETACDLAFHTDSSVHAIAFGRGQWKKGSTTRRGPNLVTRARNGQAALGVQQVAGYFSWKDPQTLELQLLYTQSPHTEIMRCHFLNDSLWIEAFPSFLPKQTDTIRTVAVAPRPNGPKLIIRGDDMGYAHSGNQALIESYTKGIETSIEVITPSPWFPEAAALLRDHPQVQVGLHFAITSEWDNIKWRPLSAAPSLRNADGYFYSMLWPNRYYPGQSVKENNWKLADVEAELRAQIALAKKYIPRLHHISGHMGVQSLSQEVKDMVRRVAAENNLVAVDIPAASGATLRYFPADLGGKMGEEKIQAFIRGLDQLEDGQTYLFLEHPGLESAELRAIYHTGYENVAEDRQGVTNLFTDPRVKAAIVRKGIRLTGYRN